MRKSSVKRVVVIDTGYESYEQERAILDRIGAVLEPFEGEIPEDCLNPDAI